MDLFPEIRRRVELGRRYGAFRDRLPWRLLPAGLRARIFTYLVTHGRL